MISAAPWLAHYDSDVPQTLEPYPNRTLVDYLTEAAQTDPDAPALLFKGARLSFAELDRLSDACASASPPRAAPGTSAPSSRRSTRPTRSASWKGRSATMGSRPSSR